MDCQLFYVSAGQDIGRTDSFRFRKKAFLWITPLPRTTDIHLTAAQEKLLSFLQQYPQGVALSNITKVTGFKNVSSAVRGLFLAGLLRIEEKQNKQLSRHSETIVTLDKSKIAGIKLTDKQEKIIGFIQTKGPITLNDLIDKSNISSAVIKRLRDKGIIIFYW